MSRILFVVEGAKTEKDHIRKVAESIFKLAKENYQISVYGTTIHTLYRAFKSGNYDSIVSFLAESHTDLNLTGLKANEVFSAIYLIFDFDPQSPEFSQKELLSCATYFQDETRNGKLYLNYPMFESLRDVTSENESDYLELSVPIKGLSSSSYKKLVNKRTIFKKPSSKKVLAFIPPEKIPFVIGLNEKKYDLLCGVNPLEPWGEVNTPLLLEQQISLMNDKQIVSVINTFLLLIKDYNPNLLAIS